MVTPVSGLLTKTQRAKGPPTSMGYYPTWWYRHNRWYRQRKPYRLILAQDLEDRRVLSYFGAPYGYLDAELELNDWNGEALTSARNQAYSRFKASVGDRAMLTVSLAERKQAMEMMESRLLQLYRFTHQLRRGNLGRAARELGLTKVPGSARSSTFRSNAKHWSSTYLEFHFGWSPLVNDIGSAISILQSGIPPVYVRGRGRGTHKVSRTPPNGLIIESWNTRVETSAVVRVINPNLHLADTLGFVNPLTVAWELVPFSFVVGWFVNVEEFLSQFTDFVGLDLSSPRTTSIQECLRQYRQAPANKYGDVMMVKKSRTPGLLPGPTLKLRDPWVLSPRRGLAAASLLVQKFIK